MLGGSRTEPVTDAPLVGYAVTAKIRARDPRHPAVTATRRQMWEHILGEASGVRRQGTGVALWGQTSCPARIPDA